MSQGFYCNAVEVSYIPSPCDMCMKFVLVINLKLPTLVGILKIATRPTDTVCCFEQKIASIHFILFVMMLHVPVKKCSVMSGQYFVVFNES